MESAPSFTSKKQIADGGRFSKGVICFYIFLYNNLIFCEIRYIIKEKIYTGNRIVAK